jgi:hypothetical protein
VSRLVASIVVLGACLGVFAGPAAAHGPLRAVPHAEAPWLVLLATEAAPVIPLAPALSEAGEPSIAPAPWARFAPVRGDRGLALAALVLAALVLAGIPALARRMVARSLRSSLAVALVVVLCAIAFESAVHSVHHLASEQEAARCSLASISTNLSADAGPEPAADVLLPASTPSVAVAEPVAPGMPPRRPHAGRAPPLSLPA